MTVAAVIERKGRFLVVEERLEDGEVVFNQPAGHLEHGETLIEAIGREVLEETAWRFRPEGVIGLYLYPTPNPHITYLRICFRGSCFEQEPERVLDEGIIRAIWLSREELASMPERLRSPMVLGCIDDYLAGRHYPLELISSYPWDRGNA